MKIKIYIDMDGVLADFSERMARETTPLLRRIQTELERAEDKLRVRLPVEIGKWEKTHAHDIEQDQLLFKFVRSLKDTPLGEVPEVRAYKKIYNNRRGAEAQIFSAPGHYFDLKPMPDMNELLSFVRTIDPNPTILTAPISGKPEAVEACAEEKRQWVKKFIPDFHGQIIVDSEKFKYATPEPGTVKILIDDRSKNLVPWKEAGGISIMHTSAASTNQQLKKIRDSLMNDKKNNALIETMVRSVVEEQIMQKTAEPSRNVSYTALVLTKESKKKLLSSLGEMVREVNNMGYEIIAHHMTINMGAFKGDRSLIGRTFQIQAVTIGMDDKVMAVGVTSPDIKSGNAVPHITIAVNRAEGGKPQMSNKLTTWEPLEGAPITLDAVLTEVV